MFVETDRSTLAPDKWETGDESIGVYGHIQKIKMVVMMDKYKIYLFSSQM